MNIFKKIRYWYECINITTGQESHEDYDSNSLTTGWYLFVKHRDKEYWLKTDRLMTGTIKEKHKEWYDYTINQIKKEIRSKIENNISLKSSKLYRVVREYKGIDDIHAFHPQYKYLGKWRDIIFPFTKTITDSRVYAQNIISRHKSELEKTENYLNELRIGRQK